jgi:hypothetical protein
MPYSKCRARNPVPSRSLYRHGARFRAREARGTPRLMMTYTGSRRPRVLRAATFVAPTAALLLAGCAAITHQELVNDAGRPRPMAAAVSTHCSGSEWMDNSMYAVVPVPIVAFASPTQEMNEIRSDDVLARCGPSDRIVNQRVEVNRSWCVPTVLTRLITLGVWHWCPASVTWNADVVAPAATVAEAAPPSVTTQSQTYRRRESVEY